MNTKVGVVTGAVRKVFLPTGKLIKSLDEFEDQCVYICSGAEALKKDLCELILNIYRMCT